ncbi:MAG: hypothetical protein QXX41_04050 [Nitrososphaerota archaeon]
MGKVKVPLAAKGRIFEIMLGFLILFGCFIFLRGPIIYNGSLNETRNIFIRLEPKENHTINFPLSNDQAFYIVSGRNLIIDDRIRILINGTSTLTLFRVSWNGTNTIVSNITNYYVTISYFDLKDTKVLLLANFNPDPVYVQVYLVHEMIVMMADYTYAFIGFSTLCLSLFILQLMIVTRQRKTVVEVILLSSFKKFLKFKKERNDVFMYGCIILEICVPVLFLGTGIYVLIMSGILSIKIFFCHAIDYFMRMILIMMTLTYFLSAVIFSFYLLFHILEKKLLERKSEDLVDLYKELSGSANYGRKTFTGISFVLLVFILVLIIKGLDIWVLLLLTLLSLVLVFTIVYSRNVKLLMKKFEKTKIICFIDIDAKAIGMWIFGIIGLFASFALLEQVFKVMTVALIFVDFHPTLLINLGKTFIEWVTDMHNIFFKLQVFGCLIIILPYWIIRSSSYLVSREYAIRKLSTDLVNFSIVFSVSQYLSWVAQGLTINGLLISLLISLTSSVLRELIREFLEKESVL